MIKNKGIFQKIVYLCTKKEAKKQSYMLYKIFLISMLTLGSVWGSQLPVLDKAVQEEFEERIRQFR